MLAKHLQHYYQRQISRHVCTFDPSELTASMIVFAPHQDDETLGCGGMIIRRTRANAKVKVVYLTDGHTSHQHLMDPVKLAALRESEAIAACGRLGVGEQDVIFMQFPDSRLHMHIQDAVDQAVSILRQYEPAEVFIPYTYDEQPDHQATRRIVLEALDIFEKPVIVNEYPVWFWYHWPWISMKASSGRELKTILKNTMTAWFGLRLMNEMNYVIDIRDILEEKKAALAEHQSQMVHMFSDPRWPTLVDLSDGEFLACFFHPEEVFVRYLRQHRQFPERRYR